MRELWKFEKVAESVEMILSYREEVVGGLCAYGID